MCFVTRSAMSSCEMRPRVVGERIATRQCPVGGSEDDSLLNWRSEGNGILFRAAWPREADRQRHARQNNPGPFFIRRCGLAQEVSPGFFMATSMSTRSDAGRSP